MDYREKNDTLNFFRKIGGSRLVNIIDSIKTGDSDQFKRIRGQFPEYDTSFLWLLCYPREGMITKRKYIVENYKKFHKILDPDFPKKLASRGNFESRMWEMILCDALSVSGELIPKGETGADFLVKDRDGQYVQIEAVAPDESDDEDLRSIRPDFNEGNFFGTSGNIEDLERPILLRVFDKGIIEKAERKKYDKTKPLIIAINSCKTVGLVSFDQYVLRRILFGLGFNTIRKNEDGSYSDGLQQNPLLNKPNKESFGVAVFRNPKYKHISGIIYTSQRSLEFIPGGYAWYNSGITFIPNPIANHEIKLEFPFFKKILCNEEKYQEIDAERKFESSISLN